MRNSLQNKFRALFWLVLCFDLTILNFHFYFGVNNWESVMDHTDIRTNLIKYLIESSSFDMTSYKTKNRHFGGAVSLKPENCIPDMRFAYPRHVRKIRNLSNFYICANYLRKYTLNHRNHRQNHNLQRFTSSRGYEKGTAGMQRNCQIRELSNITHITNLKFSIFIDRLAQ